MKGLVTNLVAKTCLAGLLLTGSATATEILASNFDGNTGATEGTGAGQGLNIVSGGGPTLTVSYTGTAAATGSVLTAVSPGDGFEYIPGAFTNQDRVTIGDNLNIAPKSDKRGFTLTFTADASYALSNLNVIVYNMAGNGVQGQATKADVNVEILQGATSVFSGAKIQNQFTRGANNVPIASVLDFDLTGTPLVAGTTYTLAINQNNVSGGAFATFDGFTLEGFPDADGDGLDDAYEQTIIDFDPNDTVVGLEDVMGTGAAPAVTDFDNDGSNDRNELVVGTSAVDPDSDDDGFYDGAETNSGFFISYDYNTNTGDTGTDPLDDDSDDDGLLDGVESGTGTFVSASKTGSDPLNSDSDGDLYSDFVEVNGGSNPVLDTSVPSHSILSSNFDGNTGATILPGDTDNTSGSATLGVTWIKRAAVTSISDLTAISTGDSGTIGGFAQLQDGLATYANEDNVFLARNMSLDAVRTTTRRGYSTTFTIDSPIPLGQLSLITGQTNNTGNVDQNYQSDVVFSLSGGTLGAPVTGTSTQLFWELPDYHTVLFDLSGTTLGAGTYTLEVYQTNLNGGGAYAIFDGIHLDDASVLPSQMKIVSAGFNGASFEVQVTGLNPTKQYILQRSDNLTDGFPTPIGTPVTPASETEVFIDPSPSGSKGFYRVEESP